jgi:hypothetical protein
MKTLHTTLVLSALVAMLAMPASAQNPPRPALHQVTVQFQVPSGDDVIVDGRYRGADPDPRIRSELAREVGDWSATAGVGY